MEKQQYAPPAQESLGGPEEAICFLDFLLI
jgi:hypothetical protein